MTILAPPEPTASILSSPPATRVVRWRCRGVAALAAADLAAIEAILRDHAAASVVERRERAMPGEVPVQRATAVVAGQPAIEEPRGRLIRR